MKIATLKLMNYIHMWIYELISNLMKEKFLQNFKVQNDFDFEMKRTYKTIKCENI